MRPSKDRSGRETRLKATFARYDDRPDECTLHPVHPDEERRTTEWMTAKRGAYVALGMWR